MRRFFLIVLILSIAVSSFAADTIRVMTYNMAVGLLADMNQLGEYIRLIDADIVALQEVDLRTYRPETPQQAGKNQMAELGGTTDMLPLFGPVTPHPSGGYYGLGFLTEEPVYSVQIVHLPKVVDNDEPRAMLVATWKLFGRTITIANTHLSLSKSNRAAQMRFIRKYMRKIGGVKLICGDFNSDYSEGLVKKIFRHWKDALPYPCNTFPSSGPYAKYDWMLYQNACSIHVSEAVVDSACHLSDHLPCYIDIVLQ